MFNKHLISAVASLSITLAMFTGIEAYAASLARTPLKTETVAQVPFEAELQQNLETTRRQVQDNVQSAAADLPTLSIVGMLQEIVCR